MYFSNAIIETLQILDSNTLPVINEHAALQPTLFKGKKCIVWITEHKKRLIQRDKTHKKSLKNKTSVNLQYYRQLRNFRKYAIVKEKIVYFSQFSLKKGPNDKKLNITSNKTTKIPKHLCDAEHISNFMALTPRQMRKLVSTAPIFIVK